MAKVKKEIIINAPVEKIFNYVDDPSNLPEVWPSLVEVTDVKTLPNGGHSNRFVFKMAGIHIKGVNEVFEYLPNQRTVAKTSGIESTLTWAFEPEARGTKVTFEAEYTVPIPVLGKIAEAIIVKMNDHEGEVLLANLKARMEA
jgi:uncharacterized protein YndB with AHSA1/START domain